MTWNKIDDNFSIHPKIWALSDAAVRLHLAALNHCSRHLTDGRLSGADAARLAPMTGQQASAAIKALLAAGLWIEVENGREGAEMCTRSAGDVQEKARTRRGRLAGDVHYEVHDYLAYNPSRAEVEAKREKAAQRIERWRKKKSQTPDPDAAGNAVRNASRNASSNAAPIPSHPIPPSKSRNNSTVDPPDVPAADAAAEEDKPPPLTEPPGHPPIDPPALIEAIWAHIAASELQWARQTGTVIHAPDAWCNRVLEPIRAMHTDTVTAWAARYDGHQPRHSLDVLASDLAEQLDPRWGPLDDGRARTARAIADTRNRIDTEQAQHAALAAEDARIDAAIDALTPDQLAAHQAAVAHIDQPTLRRQAIRARIANTLPPPDDPAVALHAIDPTSLFLAPPPTEPT